MRARGKTQERTTEGYRDDSARYTSGSKERRYRGKPARRSTQIRSQLNSGMTCAHSRLSRIQNSFSRRFQHASFAPVCACLAALFSASLPPSLPPFQPPRQVSSRMPRWARLVRNSNSKAPASERADFSLVWILGLTYITYETRGERALPLRHNEALGGVIKGSV